LIGGRWVGDGVERGWRKGREIMEEERREEVEAGRLLGRTGN